MNKDWCFEPLKKYGGFIQTEQEYKEVMKIVEENLHKDKNEDKLITIHKTLLEAKDKEIERLNNIIDELEKWLEYYIKLFNKPDMLEEQTLEDLKEVLDKLKALKEGK